MNRIHKRQQNRTTGLKEGKAGMILTVFLIFLFSICFSACQNKEDAKTEATALSVAERQNNVEQLPGF